MALEIMGQLFTGCCLYVCTNGTPALLAIKPCKHPEILSLQNVVAKCKFTKKSLKCLRNRKQILRLRKLLKITWYFLILSSFFAAK